MRNDPLSPYDQKRPLDVAGHVARANGKELPQPTAIQTALDWSPDGSAVVTEIDANRVARRRVQTRELLRSDARRTAEYLATRGTTPIEALHDLVKLGWRRAVRDLAKELGIPKERAMAIWQRAAEALLPYTAARFETLELGPQAAGGVALGHFLAARAMSEALASERAGPAGGPAEGAATRALRGPSRAEDTLDGSRTLDLALQDNDIGANGSGDTAPIRNVLPPKGVD
jgi:hypothetical protein